MNTQQTINQTNLIYTKVSLLLPTMLSLYILWPWSALVIALCGNLESSFMNIFRIIAIVSITIGSLRYYVHNKLVSNSCTFYLL